MSGMYIETIIYKKDETEAEIWINMVDYLLLDNYS